MCRRNLTKIWGRRSLFAAVLSNFSVPLIWSKFACSSISFQICTFGFVSSDSHAIKRNGSEVKVSVRPSFNSHSMFQVHNNFAEKSCLGIYKDLGAWTNSREIQWSLLWSSRLYLFTRSLFFLVGKDVKFEEASTIKGRNYLPDRVKKMYSLWWYLFE